MKAYLFEVRADGSIGATYYFDAHTVPDQVVPEGSTLLRVSVTGQETAEELADLQDARIRPQRMRVDNGRVKVREEREP